MSRLAVEVRVDVAESDRNRVEVILGRNLSEEELWSGLGRAALREYVQMVCGSQAPTRGSDMLENRLVLLVKELGEVFLEEETVAQAFQLTRTRARSLMRTTFARHRLSIEGVMQKTIQRVLKRAKPGGKDARGTFTVGPIPPLVLEKLNEALHARGGRWALPRHKGSVSLYDGTKEAINELRHEFGLEKLK